MYKLTSENLTNVGGPMGNNFSWANWSKYFKRLKNAKVYAEEDYGEPLKWKKFRVRTLSTKDLGYVMYFIEEIKTED